MSSPLLILSGSTDAGKSHAGAFLESVGGTRIKILPLLNSLTSGVEMKFGDVLSRVGFSISEFHSELEQIVMRSGGSFAVLESVIVPEHALQLQAMWSGTCQILFVDAPLEIRVARVMASYRDERAVRSSIVRKDVLKGIDGSRSTWIAIADHVIINVMHLKDYERRLREIGYELRAMKKLRDSERAAHKPAPDYQSAGGIIARSIGGRREYLLLFQRRANGEEQWVCPKGGILSDESPVEAARREVWEECGIRVDKPVAYLGQQRFAFNDGDGRALTKTVDWFGFMIDGDSEVSLETATGIAQHVWLPFSEALERVTHNAFQPYLREAELQFTTS